MKKGFRIKKVTAFVAIDTNDEEGVMAFQDKEGKWLPLICGDEDRIKSMYPIAESMSRIAGMPFRVIQFSLRMDVTDEIKEKYPIP